MNRSLKISGSVVAVLLSGCAGAVSPQVFSSDGLSQIALEVYKEPSPEADLMYHILVAELAGKRGHFQVALENYQIAARASNDPKVSERAVNIAQFMDNKVAMLEMARRWYDLAPDNIQARQILALALLRNGLLDEAMPHLDAVRLAAVKDGQEGFSAVNKLFAHLQDSEIGFQVMQRLRERYPQSKFVLYYYALSAKEAEHYEQGLEGLEAVLMIDPQWGQAYLLRTQIMMDQGDSDTALESLAKAVNKLPEDKILREGYARLLVGAGRLDQARHQFQILAKQSPQDSGPLYALGLLAAEAKDYNEAIAYLKQVLQHGERVTETYYELGKIEELRGNYPQAREWYGRINDGEHYLDAQIRIGLTFAKSGEFSAVTEHFAELRRENPRYVIPLYVSEAEILREEGHYQSAFGLLTRALEQYPDDKDLLYTRALLAERLDRLDILEQDLHLILKEDPENGHALNALGYTLADRTHRYQEALDYLKQAIALLPDDPAVLDSMGWVNYRLGNYKESLDYLRRAYELNTDSEIAAHLTEVLWVSGHKDEALDIWRRALEKDPESEFLIKVKEKLNL